ncbi:MAG: hypothetical protein IOC82_01060 [Aestuariivirga sp.]|uniref:hypothetical protein n=1 Tax=Aestuariivirga sp. TaxID=2650926 RepID=UPI0025C561A6|nr:hypothetical protein [Aestuariivirga sp.]MCA3559603.1 hypothetical protein [Aestuariivirga sp.]
MKSLLTVAALLVGLAASAQAEEVTTAPPPQPQAQAALAPAQDAPPADNLPQTAPESEAAMSAPLDANAPPPARGGGCGHAKTTVDLTN